MAGRTRVMTERSAFFGSLSARMQAGSRGCGVPAHVTQ